MSNATALESIFLRAKSAKIGHFLGPLLNKYYLPQRLLLTKVQRVTKMTDQLIKSIRNNESVIVSAVKYVGKSKTSL